jgi:hypothetical protein
MLSVRQIWDRYGHISISCVKAGTWQVKATRCNFPANRSYRDRQRRTFSRSGLVTIEQLTEAIENAMLWLRQDWVETDRRG